MADIQDIDVLKPRDATHKTRQDRRAMCLAVMIFLLSISCGVGPGLSQLTATASIPAPVAATSTAVPVPASLSVSAATPCRTGPTELDELVSNLQAGEKAQIVGKSTGFWVVKTADGSECWVADQGVTTEGEVAAVPIAKLPPTPAPVAPAAPISLQSISAVCTKKIVKKKTQFVNQFHLAWQDMSNNEDGFRVYRDGDRIAELPANATELVDEVTRNNNRTYIYSVSAYNALGETKSEPIVLSCEGHGGGSAYPGGGLGPGGGTGP